MWLSSLWLCSKYFTKGLVRLLFWNVSFLRVDLWIWLVPVSLGWAEDRQRAGVLWTGLPNDQLYVCLPGRGKPASLLFWQLFSWIYLLQFLTELEHIEVFNRKISLKVKIGVWLGWYLCCSFCIVARLDRLFCEHSSGLHMAIVKHHFPVYRKLRLFQSFASYFWDTLSFFSWQPENH